MTYLNNSRRLIASVLSLSIMWLSIFSSLTHADLISTGEMQQQEQLQYDRQQLLDLISQAELQDKFIDKGVDMDNAKERINNLTSDELAQLNAQINELPAGGDILGIIVLFLLVFIVTDIIGATDIFPFINPVNNSSK